MATLHHAHLMASDIDRTIGFWVGCFGGRVVADLDLAGVRNVLMEVGGGRLNLYAQPPNHRGVVNHLGVHVDDVEATVATLTNAGWTPRPIKVEGSLSYAMVQGPDEVLIEVFRFDPETTEPRLRPYFDLPQARPAEADRTGGSLAVPGGGDLSPQARARLARTAPEPLTMPDPSDPEAVDRWRTDCNRGWLDGDPPPASLGHEEVIVGGVRCLAVNGNQPRGTLIYAHGGGFCLGSPEVAVPITSRIAGRSDADDAFRLLSVAYRLAPEHPYPAALEDLLAVLAAVATDRPGEPLILAGDSAGANLALAAALAAPETTALAGLVLLSPYLDLREPDADHRIEDPSADVDPAGSRWLTDAYRATIDLDDPRISPLRADHHGLPPMLIQAGTRDSTMHDAIRMARHARAAGVGVTLDLWDGLWHTWHYHRELPEADAALVDVGRFINDRLRATSPR